MAAYDPVSISSWPHCLFSYFIIFKSFKYFFLSITEQVLQMPTLEPLKWLSLSFEPLPLRYSHALSLILFLCSIVTLVNMVLAILLKPPPLIIPFSVAIMVDLLLAKIFHSPFSHLGVKIVFLGLFSYLGWHDMCRTVNSLHAWLWSIALLTLQYEGHAHHLLIKGEVWEKCGAEAFQFQPFQLSPTQFSQPPISRHMSETSRDLLRHPAQTSADQLTPDIWAKKLFTLVGYCWDFSDCYAAFLL